MTEASYSVRNQLKRHLRLRFRFFDTWHVVCGTHISLLAFYPLNTPGGSQVFDVALPYLFAAFHIVAAIVAQTQLERTRPTAAFFFNLPRERPIASLATALYFLGHALYYELVIAVGVFLKLGNAGITPIYRVHPELVIAPIVAVFVGLWLVHRPRGWRVKSALLGGLLLLATGLTYRYLHRPAATPDNGFLPPRDIPLTWEWGIALTLAGLGAALLWRRSHQRNFELGDLA